jgi:hypothetical protein
VQEDNIPQRLCVTHRLFVLLSGGKFTAKDRFDLGEKMRI